MTPRHSTIRRTRACWQKWLTFLLLKHAAPPRIYTLSLHDALPISVALQPLQQGRDRDVRGRDRQREQPVLAPHLDRKSTRLNSSHMSISYAVFCLKKKKDNISPDNFLYRMDTDEYTIEWGEAASPL